MKDKEKQIKSDCEKCVHDNVCYDCLMTDKCLGKDNNCKHYEPKLPEDSVSTTKAKVFDILNKFEFFQGQRAGRELWNDKPKEVQDKDIADFVRDIKYVRSYLKDSVVLSREEFENNLTLYMGYKIGSKETAEKIVCLIKTFCPDKKFIETITHIIAERFGIEIKE